jgi:hypothetical protein
MTRMLRSSLVLALVVVGLGCGTDMTEESMAPSIEASSHDPAAHIVCSAGDPCPKGTICVGHIRCAKLCNTDTDCPSGQTCRGSLGGKKFCSP